MTANRPVGPWAKTKLASLAAYLDYYTKRLKNQPWCRGTWFIDAFAGPGVSPVRRSEREQRLQDSFLEEPTDPETADAIEFVKGSPRVALEVANPFTHYIFVEKDLARVAELTKLRAEFPQRNIDIRQGDANTEIEAFLAGVRDWKSNKGVAFLDPFGMQLPWSTVEAIAKTRGIEILLNFPWMGISRMLPRSGDVPPAWADTLDSAFGSPEWRELAYERTTDLIGGTLVRRHDVGPRILEWFSGRLRAAFGYASAAQLISNTRNTPLYYLIWAGPHPAGLKGADYILGKKTNSPPQQTLGI
jgi:three-Cys-motif partner protein